MTITAATTNPGVVCHFLAPTSCSRCRQAQSLLPTIAQTLTDCLCDDVWLYYYYCAYCCHCCLSLILIATWWLSNTHLSITICLQTNWLLIGRWDGISIGQYWPPLTLTRRFACDNWPLHSAIAPCHALIIYTQQHFSALVNWQLCVCFNSIRAFSCLCESTIVKSFPLLCMLGV